MNFFEEIYLEMVRAERLHETATDEAEKKEATAIYSKAEAAIKELGNTACRIFRIFKDSKECGNPYLDINDVVWEKDVEELLSCMRDNGIDRFTFSSTWSGAVETAWLFQQNGCRLEGLVEVKSLQWNFATHEYEKRHGYLFSLS